MGSICNGKISVSPIIGTEKIHGNPNGCSAFQCINVETTWRSLQQIAMTPKFTLNNTREINRSIRSKIAIDCSSWDTWEEIQLI